MAKKDLGGKVSVRRSKKGMTIGDASDLHLIDGASLSGSARVLETNPQEMNEIRGNAQLSNPDRLELGISILQHVEGQLNRADSKAQFTLTLDALLIASSAFLGSGASGEVTRLNAMTLSYRFVAIFGIAMFVTLLISTVYALLAVIPRFTPKNMANQNIFYFGNIVQQDRKEFAEHYGNQSRREIEKMLMSEIHDLSGIAKQKFALIRISYIFLFFALGFWSIVQMILLLTR